MSSFVSIVDASVPTADSNYTRGTFVDEVSARHYIDQVLTMTDRNLGESADYQVVPGTQLGDSDEPVVVTLEIDNAYENYGDVSVTIENLVIAAPDADEDSDEYEDWKQDWIIRWTGVGLTDGDSWYDVTVKASSRPQVLPVDTTFDWGY